MHDTVPDHWIWVQPDGRCRLDSERTIGHELAQESGGIGKEAHFVPTVEPASNISLSDGPGTMGRGEFRKKSARGIARADDLTCPAWTICKLRATYLVNL